MNEVVPVTLVTGFLGSGKTTLLNRILRASPAQRFAVVENEFGELGIDGLLVDTAVDALFELTDGCVCCTVRDDLVEVFSELAVRAQSLDHVLVETSGLADPVPVMRLMDLPWMQAAFRLDGVVTVVDAGNVRRDLEESRTCSEQITYADLIVVNKCSEVSESSLVWVEDRLRALNPLARVVRADHADVPLPWVLELGARDVESMLKRRERLSESAEHGHDDAITSVAVEAAGDVDVVALDRWLGELVRSPDLSLLRTKGVLSVRGQPQRFVFHGVRGAVEVRPDRPWGEAERGNRVVFIGRGLDPEELRTGLLACVLPPR